MHRQHEREDDGRGVLRLRDHRRGLGRQRAGQPAERGRHRLGAGARGRAQRLASLHSCARRLHQDLPRCARELALQHGAEPMDRRPAHPGAARQDAGRLQLHQRQRLQSRPAHGLRHLGPARQPRLGLCRRAPLLQALERRLGGGDDRPTADATAISPSPTWIGATPCARPSSKARSVLGIPRNPDYNGAIQEGVVLRPAHHLQRPAGQRRDRLPASRAQARQPERF